MNVLAKPLLQTALDSVTLEKTKVFIAGRAIVGENDKPTVETIYTK